MELIKSGDFTHDLFGSLTTIKSETGDVYFIGKEVATMLGYSNASKTIDDHVRLKFKMELNNETLSSLGMQLGQRGATFISEAGLYSLVMKSKKEEAEKFQDWVMDEVLPSIRKTGSYSIKTEEQQLLSLFPNTDVNLVALTANTIRDNKKKDELIKLNAPKVEFANKVASSSDCIDIGTFAKLVSDELDLGRNKMFALLRSKSILMKNNQPYQKYVDNGTFKTVEQTFKTAYGEKISIKTLLTGQGQIKLLEKLRKLTK